MARFIHLNGPPGIGKSTVASMFAERHPGMLNLDIDQVVSLIGGWRNSFATSFESARLIAAGMAQTHLTSGCDVIMPQLITNQREIADFERAAAAAGASYWHVALWGDFELCAGRFRQRTESSSGCGQAIGQIVGLGGGEQLLKKIYGQLTDFLAAKSMRATINGNQQSPDQLCELLEIICDGASLTGDTGSTRS